MLHKIGEDVQKRMPRKIWIAIMAYTGMIHLGTMRSIIADMVQFSTRGDCVTPFDECGNAMIAHARDMALAQFLASDGTDLIFIDDDVIWEPGALPKLIDHEAEFVAGLYPQRKDPLNFCVRWKQQPEIWSNSAGLIAVDGVPAGFMRLRRSVVEKMVAAYPNKRFDDPNAPDGHAYALFDNIHEGTAYWGEDFSFCKRWLDIGGEIFVDPEIRLGHVGYKTFVGSLADWLRNRMNGDKE